MEQNLKELLFHDLCARLPYGVKIHVTYTNAEYDEEIYGIVKNEYGIPIVNPCENDIDKGLKLEQVRPYLRPMSSMTEEEQKEFVAFHCVNLCPIVINNCLTIDNESKMLDWLNAHHFDYRMTDDGKTMIEAGLALPASEGMYKTE